MQWFPDIHIMWGAQSANSGTAQSSPSPPVQLARMVEKRVQLPWYLHVHLSRQSWSYKKKSRRLGNWLPNFWWVVGCVNFNMKATKHPIFGLWFRMPRFRPKRRIGSRITKSLICSSSYSMFFSAEGSSFACVYRGFIWRAREREIDRDRDMWKKCDSCSLSPCIINLQSQFLGALSTRHHRWDLRAPVPCWWVMPATGGGFPAGSVATWRFRKAINEGFHKSTTPPCRNGSGESMDATKDQHGDSSPEISREIYIYCLWCLWCINIDVENDPHFAVYDVYENDVHKNVDYFSDMSNYWRGYFRQVRTNSPRGSSTKSNTTTQVGAVLKLPDSLRKPFG